MDISDRIQQFIEYKGLNPTSFSRAIGLTNNVTIIRLIKEKRTPQQRTIEHILRAFPSLNREWLLFGKGNMENPSRKADSFNFNNEDDIIREELNRLKEENLKLKDEIIRLQKIIIERNG